MKEKRSAKAKSKQLAQVTIVAKSLVCDASSALICSPPCGSSFVFEVTHTVYKCASNERAFGEGYAFHNY